MPHFEFIHLINPIERSERYSDNRPGSLERKLSLSSSAAAALTIKVGPGGQFQGMWLAEEGY